MKKTVEMLKTCNWYLRPREIVFLRPSHGIWKKKNINRVIKVDNSLAVAVLHALRRLCSFYGEDDTGSNLTHKHTVLLTVFFMGKSRLLTLSA